MYGNGAMTGMRATAAKVPIIPQVHKMAPPVFYAAAIGTLVLTYCRAAIRFNGSPDSSNYYVGFRVVVR